MKIAENCIKHNVMTILVYILIAVFGFYCFQSLPLALMPEMELPVAIVYSTYAGAGPEDIEQQVTEPLEAACASLSGLESLTSTSAENMSMVIAQFDYGVNLDEVLTDMRDNVDLAQAQLPEDATDPVVMSIDIDSMPVIMVALRGSDLASLQSIAEDDLAPALERLDGVASVDISGGYENEVAVKVDAARLRGYNLTLTTLAQQLGAINNVMSNHMFQLLEQQGVPTHFVEQLSDRETVVKKVSIVPLEVIVRNISAGSFAKRYGVKEGIVFDEPTFELSYKNDDLGDPLMNDYHAIALKLATREEIELIKSMTFKINEVMKQYFDTLNVTLVDFKLEFGKTADGTIVLADEISPDTCRLWDKTTGEKLDKDRFRRDMGGVEEAYQEIMKRVMSK